MLNFYKMAMLLILYGHLLQLSTMFYQKDWTSMAQERVFKSLGEQMATIQSIIVFVMELFNFLEILQRIMRLQELTVGRGYFSQSLIRAR